MTRKILKISLIIILLIGFYLLLSREKVPDLETIQTFEDCAAAGYPIMESYPEQCRTPDGRNFVRNVSGTPTTQATTTFSL